MTQITIPQRQQVRADTASRWMTFNPTLLNKELALVLDDSTGDPVSMAIGKTDTAYSALQQLQFIQQGKPLSIESSTGPQITVRRPAGNIGLSGLAFTVADQESLTNASPHELWLTFNPQPTRNGFCAAQLLSLGTNAVGGTVPRTLASWSNVGTCSHRSYGTPADTGSTYARTYLHVVETQTESGISSSYEMREIFNRDGTWSIKRADPSPMIIAVPWNIPNNTDSSEYLRIRPAAQSSGIPVMVQAASLLGESQPTQLALAAGGNVQHIHPLATWPAFKTVVSSDNWSGWSAAGGTSLDGSVYLDATGGNDHISQVFTTKGAGAHTFRNGSGGINLQVTSNLSGGAATASWVLMSGDTGSTPLLYSTGSASNTGLAIRSKGYGVPIFIGTDVFTGSLIVNTTANANNGVSVVTGDSAVPTNDQSPSSVSGIFASGNDTDVDLLLRGKGAGAIRFGTITTVTGAPATTGYITIRDDEGNLRKLAVID